MQCLRLLYEIRMNKKLHNHMFSVKEPADRMWAGKDIEMIITAASNAYRNDM